MSEYASAREVPGVKSNSGKGLIRWTCTCGRPHATQAGWISLPTVSGEGWETEGAYFGCDCGMDAWLDGKGTVIQRGYKIVDRGPVATPIEHHVFQMVFEELRKAQSKHDPMHSHHEAYAVIAEELEEYWEEVKKRQPDHGAMGKELLQVATMAVRAILDLEAER